MLYPHKFGNNPLFPQDTDFRVTYKNNTAGFGVLCLRAFKQGDIMAAIDGERVSDIRQHTLQITPDLHLLDRYFSGFFLHSCSPNISLDMNSMTVTALKNIKPNSYLYMDYAQTEDLLYKQFACSCGSGRCRSWITGRQEIAPSLLAQCMPTSSKIS